MENHKIDLTSSDDVTIRIVDEQSSNSIYKVTKDKEIVVVLKGNITTGYNWMATSKTLEDSDIEFLNLQEVQGHKFGEYQSDSNPNKLCGVGGTFIFKLKVNKEGSKHVAFEYKRVWEKNECDQMIIKLEVV